MSLVTLLAESWDLKGIVRRVDAACDDAVSVGGLLPRQSSGGSLEGSSHLKVPDANGGAALGGSLKPQDMLDVHCISRGT